MAHHSVILLSAFASAIAAGIFQCPQETVCSEPGTIESLSFEFLKKLSPKQLSTITKLIVTNASLENLPEELKYLRHLRQLDLSRNVFDTLSMPPLPNLKELKLKSNNLNHLSLCSLPKNIEDLDLSGNLLNRIPKDWNCLKMLKVIHLQKNPIDCDCLTDDNFITYVEILRHNIQIPEQVLCHTPKEYFGKNIQTVKCLDEMINDQPEEGSGEAQDIFGEESDPFSNENLYKHDSEFIHRENDEISEDGSGEEGSGFSSFDIRVPACIFDCQTPEPVGKLDSGNDSGSPGPTDQIKIIAEDVLHPIFGEPEPVAKTTTSTTSPSMETIEPIITTLKSHLVAAKKEEKVEEPLMDLSQSRSSEIEKATFVNSNNYAVYVVLICGLFLIVVFIVCLIKKRTQKRLNKSRREHTNAYGEELKVVNKPVLQQINANSDKPIQKLPEQMPLVKSSNGDTHVLDRSFIPLKHPEAQIPDESIALLTPTAERVRIRASELSDSIPRTPILVHCQKNGTGGIMATVTPP